MQIVFVCLYSTPSQYHHCANLSADIELIKCLSDIFCRVCKIKHILSRKHYTICGAVCFQFTHFPCDGWDNIYTVSYYPHQIGSMNYYPLFRVRSWNNGVRCMSFCIRGPLDHCFIVLAQPPTTTHFMIPRTLHWRHNEHNGVSNHHSLDCLFNRLFKRRSTKASKLSVTGLCEENPPVTGK